MNLRILYRGPLSSCNYDCSYCPFAKRTEKVNDLEGDRIALKKFVRWVETHDAFNLSLFFYPLGRGPGPLMVPRSLHRPDPHAPCVKGCRTNQFVLWT